MTIHKVKNDIADIGAAMINCKKKCPDVICSLETGRPPKCLYIDFEDENSDEGFVIIGMNPGSTYSNLTAKEKIELRNNEISHNLHLFESLVHSKENPDFIEFYREQLNQWKHGENCIKKKIDYYKKVREFMESITAKKQLNILWTEIVKCETKTIESEFLSEHVTIRNQLEEIKREIVLNKKEIKKIRDTLQKNQKKNPPKLGDLYLRVDLLQKRKNEILKNTALSNATRLTCEQLYLKKELDSVPNTWPIFTLDKNTFEIITGMLNSSKEKRLVIGLPHPTGSRSKEGSQFLLEKDKEKFEKNWPWWGNLNKYGNIEKIINIISDFHVSTENELISQYILSE